MWALTRQLLTLASATLPAHRSEWARAMSAECAQIDSELEALLFACGAVAAAVQERLHLQPFSEAARLAIAIAFSGLGLFHLGCAIDGLRVAFGGTDVFYVTLVETNAATAQHWRDATLPMTACWAGLGGADLAAAQFALRNRRGFFMASTVAALAAAIMMAATVFSIIGFTEGHRSFLSFIALQAVAAFSLWRFCMRPLTPEVTS